MPSSDVKISPVPSSGKDVDESECAAAAEHRVSYTYSYKYSRDGSLVIEWPSDWVNLLSPSCSLVALLVTCLVIGGILLTACSLVGCLIL